MRGRMLCLTFVVAGLAMFGAQGALAADAPDGDAAEPKVQLVEPAAPAQAEAEAEVEIAVEITTPVCAPADSCCKPKSCSRRGGFLRKLRCRIASRGR